MKPTRAGALRHRITIYDIPPGTDATGELANPLAGDALQALGTCWAKIEPLGGRELLTTQSTFGESTHRVTLRWPGFDIKQRMWIQFGSRWFDVVNGNNIEERNRRLEIICKERD